MTVETFFEKFDLLAGTPEAVPKMRELVLDLAVRGRLVEHSSGAADTLLQSLATQRARLVEARAIRGRRIDPVSQDERPFAAPEHWRWLRLCEVGHELGQKEPSAPFTYIDVGGIDSSRGQISDRIESLEPSKAPSRARKIVKRGTVIYSTVRPYLRNIAIVERNYDPEPIASTAFGILYPFRGIDARYLFYWLRSSPFTAYVEEGMKGMAYPAINDEKFYSGLIALPPLAEQRRIVAKVDQLMTLVDRLEAQLAESRDRGQKLMEAVVAELTVASQTSPRRPKMTVPETSAAMP